MQLMCLVIATSWEAACERERESLWPLHASCVSVWVCAGIPEEETNLCVSFNETDEVGYNCSSEADPIIWRVGTRQIANSADGILVNTSQVAGGGYTSTIVFTPEFLQTMAGKGEFEVACLVQIDVFEFVVADTRKAVVFSKSEREREREGGLGRAE